MLKILKWVWLKSEERATERILAHLNWAIQFHRQQAELAYYKDKYEPEPSGDDKFDKYLKEKFYPPKLSSKEHTLVADELRRLTDDIANASPKRKLAQR